MKSNYIAKHCNKFCYCWHILWSHHTVSLSSCIFLGLCTHGETQESHTFSLCEFFKNYLFFNWSFNLVALQNFVVFCQTSTWISHRQILYLCTTWEVHREKRPHFKLCRGIIAFHSHLLSSDCMSDCQNKFMKWLFYFNFHRGECKTNALKRSENSVR